LLFIIFYSIPPSPLAVARATLAVARARHGQALAVKAQNGQSRLSVGQAARAGLNPLPLREREK